MQSVRPSVSQSGNQLLTTGRQIAQGQTHVLHACYQCKQNEYEPENTQFLGIKSLELH